LELVAQQDVQIVRGLVGGNAARTRCDDVDRAMKPCRVEVGELIRKSLTEQRKIVRPESEASPDLILPKPSLRFVKADTRAIGKQSPPHLHRKALIVERMPALMQGSEDRAHRLILADANREPHVVVAGNDCERMRRAIHAAA